MTKPPELFLEDANFLKIVQLLRSGGFRHDSCLDALDGFLNCRVWPYRRSKGLFPCIGRRFFVRFTLRADRQ